MTTLSADGHSTARQTHSGAHLCGPAFDLRWGLLVLGLLSLARLVLSMHLPLFGDEAFYWQEGRYPAWAYSDLPPLTAWLTRVGTAMLGERYFGVRLAFFLCALALPLAVVALARACGAQSNDSLWAGAASLALPVHGITAPFALPEGPLNLLWILAAALTAVIINGTARWWQWPLLGVLLAGGLLTHYRFAPFLIGLAGLFLFHPPARRYLREPGPWICAVIALLALWPQWQFNAAEEFAALNFQFVDRHPWQPSLSGLRMPVVDLLLLTPVLGWWLIKLIKLLSIRRAQTHAAVLLWLGFLPILLYWCLSPLVDTQRVSFHWTLAGWLTLCAGIPHVLREIRGSLSETTVKVLLWVALVPGLVISTTLLTYWQVSAKQPQQRLPSADAVPDNLLGWPQIAARLSDLSTLHQASLIVADNFMLAAEMRFELGQPVASLDHPLNHKHGRARQLMIWDQVVHGSLPERGLLALEVTALDLQQRVGWIQAVCAQMGRGRIVDEIMLFGGRKRIVVMLIDPNAGAGEGCDQPAFWYLDEPAEGSRHTDRVIVRGWALEAHQGVAGVDIMLGGQVVGQASYGELRPGVATYFNLPSAPDHPNTGFMATLDNSTLPAGRQQLMLRIHERDGRVRLSDPRWIELASGEP